MMIKLGTILSVVLSTYSMSAVSDNLHIEQAGYSTSSTHISTELVNMFAPNQDGEEVTPMERVNINTASAEEIAKKLKGIGMSKAQAIVELRERVGQFSDIEQLLEVRGIGVRTLNTNRERIVL